MTNLRPKIKNSYFYSRLPAILLLTILLILVIPSISQAAETYQFLTKWGSNGTDTAQFDGPSGVAVDISGNVYVADQWNHRVQKFTSNGTFLIQWGSYGSGDGQFSHPSSVAVDTSGNVYIADRANNRVQKFTSNGAFITKWGSLGSGDGQFSNSYGIAIDTSDNVYVTDTFNHRVQKFDSDGNYIAKWGANGGDGTSGSGDGEFDNPNGITVDTSGNVYVADTVNNRIQKFTSNGIFITKWGSLGSGDGELFFPYGVAVNTSSDVYVADTINDRVQKFTRDGTFLTKWGGIGSGDGEFWGPLGIAVDTLGKVYVADTFNNRIQKFGLPTTSDTLTVDVDIKPGSDPNSINLGANGVIPVAILGSESFDATEVDPSTVLLEGAALRLKGKSSKVGSFDDVNGDGYQDLILHIVDFTIVEGSTEAKLTGQTYGGQPIHGSDSIRIVSEI